MLHVTNGDSAGGTLRQFRRADEVLPWRDVLHEGPVPAGLSLEGLSRVRAHFIAGCEWGSLDEVSQEFAARDAALARFSEHDEVVLWFEHDLFDQLQLIQLLDWFSTQDLTGTRLMLICIGEFPGQAKFFGLGTLTAEQLASLFPDRLPVTSAQLSLGRAAWSAFCSPNPLAIQALLDSDTSALPFLDGALRRHLEQFPSTRNGLSRTERQILEVLTTIGPSRFAHIFIAEGDREERLFMGDSTLLAYLNRLAGGDDPLVGLANGEYRITETGQRALAGEVDCVRLQGVDCWLGGVHLQGREVVWRWDEAAGRLLHLT